MSKRLLTLIVCGGLIISLSLGIRSGMGLFIKDMSADLQIGRGVIGFGIAISNLLWGLASPFLGGIADRFGTMRVAIAGALAYIAGMVVLGFSAGATEIILSNVLTGIGITGAGLSVVLGAVGRAATPEKRTLALAVVSATGSIGQFLMMPISQGLLDAYGWSTALFVLAAIAALMLPLCLGLSGDKSMAASSGQSFQQALHEAAGTRGFWLLTAGFFVCGFHVVFVGVHLPGYLAEKAMPTWLAAWALGVVGLANIVGTLAAGWLGTRFQKKTILALLYLARAIVFIGFLVIPISVWSTFTFAFLLGLLWLSTVPLTSGLVAHIFGPAYMSMLYGIVFLSHQVGSFFGAWLGGLMFDVTGSYDLMWWVSVALGVMAALLHWPIAERPVARLAAARA
jgi:MFS family permease